MNTFERKDSIKRRSKQRRVHHFITMAIMDICHSRFKLLSLTMKAQNTIQIQQCSKKEQEVLTFAFNRVQEKEKRVFKSAQVVHYRPGKRLEQQALAFRNPKQYGGKKIRAFKVIYSNKTPLSFYTASVGGLLKHQKGNTFCLFLIDYFHSFF